MLNPSADELAKNARFAEMIRAQKLFCPEVRFADASAKDSNANMRVYRVLCAGGATRQLYRVTVRNDSGLAYISELKLTD